MTQNQIIKLKLEIDNIKEYIDAEVCKKCEEMYARLEHCKNILEQIQNEKT